jgi:hypothetical protein
VGRRRREDCAAPASHFSRRSRSSNTVVASQARAPPPPSRRPTSGRATEAELAAFRAYQASKQEARRVGELPRAVAADVVEAPAAPAFDTAASVAQGRDCLARGRAAALRVAFVRSNFYATTLASRVEEHRRASFGTMERDGVPDAEARVVIDTLAPDFQALAAAELLGDAASALTRDELAAQLAQLGLGAEDVHAEAPDAMQS